MCEKLPMSFAVTSQPKWTSSTQKTLLKFRRTHERAAVSRKSQKINFKYLLPCLQTFNCQLLVLLSAMCCVEKTYSESARLIDLHLCRSASYLEPFTSGASSHFVLPRAYSTDPIPFHRSHPAASWSRPLWVINGIGYIWQHRFINTDQPCHHTSTQDE